jgi:cell shape-determining protein MreC
VTAVTKRDFGVYQQVVCAPTVDFSRLEEVLVVLAARDVIPPPPKAAKEP